MLLKLKCYKKNEIGPKLQYDQKRNVTRNEMSPKRKCHQI